MLVFYLFIKYKFNLFQGLKNCFNIPPSQDGAMSIKKVNLLILSQK